LIEAVVVNEKAVSLEAAFFVVGVGMVWCYWGGESGTNGR